MTTPQSLDTAQIQHCLDQCAVEIARLLRRRKAGENVTAELIRWQGKHTYLQRMLDRKAFEAGCAEGIKAITLGLQTKGGNL